MSLVTRLSALEREVKATPPSPTRCPICGAPDPDRYLFVIYEEPGTCPTCTGPVDASTGRTLRALLLGSEQWTKIIRIVSEDTPN